jgi:hypothetical protein
MEGEEDEERGGVIKTNEGEEGIERGRERREGERIKRGEIYEGRGV